MAENLLSPFTLRMYQMKKCRNFLGPIKHISVLFRVSTFKVLNNHWKKLEPFQLEPKKYSGKKKSHLFL